MAEYNQPLPAQETAMRHCLALTTLLLVTPSLSATAATHCAALPGQWMNENGSVLEIRGVDAQGRLDGRYHSSTGVDGRVFPLQGWVNQVSDDDVIALAWSVRWTGYGSITSWTGSCDEDASGPRLKTLWHLVRPNQDFDWERIIANGSTFRPVPTENVNEH